MMTLMTQAQSGAVIAQMKIEAPKNMKILMTKVQISFNTQASTGLKETRSLVTGASQLFLTAV